MASVYPSLARGYSSFLNGGVSVPDFLVETPSDRSEYVTFFQKRQKVEIKP